LHPEDGKHPDLFVTSQNNESALSTCVTKPGEVETINTELAPCCKNAKAYSTSNDARRTIGWGYGYPETQEWKFTSGREYRTAILEALKGPNSTLSLAFILASDGQKQKPALTKIKNPSTLYRKWVNDSRPG
jgi:hypothetical protein